MVRQGVKNRRSRSPRSRDEWISRTIAQFGRYPERHPPGLRVDITGSFRLENLMQVWGYAKHLTFEEVLAAIRRHMFHGEGDPRFNVDYHVDGSIFIQVLPRRGRRSMNSEGRYGSRSNEGPRSSTDMAIPPPPPPPLSCNVTLKGCQRSSTDIAFPAVSIAKVKYDGDVGKVVKDRRPPGMPILFTRLEPSGPATLQAKGMSLDDVISGTSATDSLNLTHRAGDANCDGPLPMRPDRSDQPDRPDRGNQSMGEKVMRWLGWVLLGGGHAELGVTVIGSGWARVDTVAEAGMRTRLDFGGLTIEKLLDIVKESDGVFETRNGILRKVPRSERSAWPQMPRASQDARVMSVIGAADRAPPMPPNAPQGPPGEHWTPYNDDISGELWWCYEGPLGRWWCEDLRSLPQPYEGG